MNLSFCDFWGDFQYDNNFFYYLFSELTEVKLTEPADADIIIFSVFGEENKKYPNKTRIFYTGENIRPDYDNLDYAFSFDFTENSKNIRVPLWLLQIDWFGKSNYGNPDFTLSYDNLEKNRFIQTPKTNFCCTVFNKPSPHRVELFMELSKYKQVHGFGRPFGNWFYGEGTKYKILSDYKFTICFENSIHPGYYTEKPIHAKTAGCVPIYWSDEYMSRDFNKKAFINLSDFDNNVKRLAEYIIEVDRNDELYNKYFTEKLFSDETDPRKLLESIKKKVSEII